MGYRLDTAVKYGAPTVGAIVAVCSLLAAMYEHSVSRQQIAITLAETRAEAKSKTDTKLDVLTTEIERNWKEHDEMRGSIKELGDKVNSTQMGIYRVEHAPTGPVWERGRQVK